MDFLKRLAPEAGDEQNPGDMSPFAASIFEKQPFKGYTLKTALASTDRTAVFAAHDGTMERRVVLKVMRPCREREGAVEEFFSLAGSIARLRCPGVARGLDAGRGDGDFFVVYEQVRGESLAARMARLQAGKLADKDALKVVGAVAEVLQRLFEHGHPHGHLKPSNIIQGEGGRTTLTDIGFAWNMAWPTDDEAFCTCPDFLPPERIEGEFNVDIRGDLYSLGAIWFLLLAGRPVFTSFSGPADTLRLHREAKPEQLHKLDEKISETTSGLVRWLLEKDRDARPRTPKEFLRRLAAHPLLVGEGAESEAEAAAPESGAAEPAVEVSGLATVLTEVEELIRETAVKRPSDEIAEEGGGSAPSEEEVS